MDALQQVPVPGGDLIEATPETYLHPPKQRSARRLMI